MAQAIEQHENGTVERTVSSTVVRRNRGLSTGQAKTLWAAKRNDKQGRLFLTTRKAALLYLDGKPRIEWDGKVSHSEGIA